MKLSANEFEPNSIANQCGAGNPSSSNSVTLEFCLHGNSYSNCSAINPYATEASRPYVREGRDRGKLSTDQYDPNSVSNLTVGLASWRVDSVSIR
jgi:hypothetical protein